MNVSVIIPNLNSLIIDQVIAALMQQTTHARISEVIVVGQDHPKRLQSCKQTLDHLTMIDTPTPISAAAARNRGAQQACSEWLLFIDADCIAAPDWVERMCACFDQGHTVVGGSVNILPDTSSYWTLCDNLLTLTPSLETSTNMWYLPSLNFGIRRALFLALGGFDESFPGAAGEDVDLSLRLRQHGEPLHFASDAQVTHRPPRSTARAVWHHLYAFGATHDRIQQLHAALRPSPLNHLSPHWYPAIALAAPALALNDVRKLFAASAAVRQHPTSAVGLWWGKLAWYAGLSNAMRLRARAS